MTAAVRLTAAARSVLRQMADADTIEVVDHKGYLAPDGLVVDLPDGWLEPAVAPCPAEPPLGSVVLADLDGGGEHAYMRTEELGRDGDAWRVGGLAAVQQWRWAELWEQADGRVTLLEPAPSTVDTAEPVVAPSIDDPVSLPLELHYEHSNGHATTSLWLKEDDAGWTLAQIYQHGDKVWTRPARLNVGQLRLLARAAWQHANAIEAQR